MGEPLPAEGNSGLWVLLPGARGADMGRTGGAALLGAARRLADGMGCRLHAMVEQDEAAVETIAYGADRVVVAADLFGGNGRAGAGICTAAGGVRGAGRAAGAALGRGADYGRDAGAGD